MEEYEKRLDEARQYAREWNRKRLKTAYGKVDNALRSYAYAYGQRISTVEKTAPDCAITLPRVSILNTEHDLTEADFRLGKACQSAAGY